MSDSTSNITTLDYQPDNKQIIDLEEEVGLSFKFSAKDYKMTPGNCSIWLTVQILASPI